MGQDKKNKSNSKPAGNNTISNRPKWQYVLLIAVLGFIVYSNTLNNPFIYDDKLIIEENRLIKSLNNIPELLVSDYWEGTIGEGQGQNLWRPLVTVSYALEHFIYGLNTTGYHLGNIAVHIFNCLLIFYIALIILNKLDANTKTNRLTALFIALIFAVHAVHTEAVTGIVGRAELMTTCFYLLAFLAYIKYNTKLKYYIISLSAFALALLSKETALTLPGIILLYDVIVSGNIKDTLAKKYKLYLGYVGVLAVYTIARLIVFGTLLPANAVSVFHEQGFMMRLLTMSKVYIKYLVLLFYPAGLSVMYDKNEFFIHSLSLESILYMGVLLLIAVIAYRVYKHSKLIAFSIAWFFVTMIPMSNIIPIGELIAERFLYLPSVGFCIIIGVLLSKIKKKEALYTVLTIILIFFSFLALNRNSDWKDNLGFWAKTLEKTPGSTKARINMASACLDAELYTEALMHLNRAIELDPEKAEAYNNRGIINEKKGRVEKAISDYNKAIELDPAYSEAHNNRGAAYAKTRRYDKALLDFNRALAIDPNNSSAYHNRLTVLRNQKSLESQVAVQDKAIGQEPLSSRAYYERALFYSRKKHNEQAIDSFNKAIELDPKYVDAYIDRGILLASQGRNDEALKDFSKAVGIDPKNDKGFANRGIIYGLKGDQIRARIDFTRAIEINPKNINAYKNRAITYRKTGRHDLAHLDEEKAKILQEKLKK